MPHKSIAQDIKKTGRVISEWLSPFYTLGTAVTFAIGMLTLLDRDGTLHLTRWIAAALLTATFLAWAKNLYLQQNKKSAEQAESPSAKPHTVLLIITGFFMVGTIASEAIMTGNRQQLQSTSSDTPSSAPAPTSTLERTAAPNPPVSLATPLAAPPTPKSLATQVSQPETTQPKNTTVLKATEPSSSNRKQNVITPLKPVDNLAGTSRNAAEERPDTTISDKRCSALIASFSLGQDLSEQEQQYLEKCR